MNDEDAFQAALDERVKDYLTRLVLADFLEEHGDPRAAGYRVIGERRLVPIHWRKDRWWWIETVTGRSYTCNLRSRWWNQLDPVKRSEGYATRRDAEDDAALAFSKLPAGSYV